MNGKLPAGHLVLAGFSGSLLLEVLIDMAAWYELVRDNAHKVDDGF